MRTVTRPHLLQVTLSDRERELLVTTARREEKTLSELVRESIHVRLASREPAEETPDGR